MFNGVKKEEYEKVVKANTELRLKMEKLRFDNTLLKDQIRILKNLQPELSRIYVLLQNNHTATSEDIKSNPQFKDVSEKEIDESLQGLMNLKLVDKLEKNGKTFYSIGTPAEVDVYAPDEGGVITPVVKYKSNNMDDSEDI
jgi:hypothetical protein